jgi:uncharacterized sporulation protein YeaH/YhbH (DUF444 family)
MNISDQVEVIRVIDSQQHPNVKIDIQSIAENLEGEGWGEGEGEYNIKF